jgi:hypothetical protein
MNASLEPAGPAMEAGAIAALVIAVIAVKEGLNAWRGDPCRPGPPRPFAQAADGGHACDCCEWAAVPTGFGRLRQQQDVSVVAFLAAVPPQHTPASALPPSRCWGLVPKVSESDSTV